MFAQVIKSTRATAASSNHSIPLVSNDTVLEQTNSNTYARIGIGIFDFQIFSNELEVGSRLLDRDALLQSADS